MEISTTRFGAMEVDKKSIIRMPRGPLGFEDEKEFFLMQHRDSTRFWWLQSATEPSLAFVVVDPCQFFSDYEIEISDSDVEKLNLKDAADAMVLTIVSIDRKSGEITANLAAPVVINAKELIGMQIVLQDDRYRVKHKLETRQNEDSADKVVAKAA